jgi:hypothetical protein
VIATGSTRGSICTHWFRQYERTASRPVMRALGRVRPDDVLGHPLEQGVELPRVEQLIGAADELLAVARHRGYGPSSRVAIGKTSAIT